ncbi:hypothetical protein Hanom_Chr12g01104771 [Helianthus anomalus]
MKADENNYSREKTDEKKRRSEVDKDLKYHTKDKNHDKIDDTVESRERSYNVDEDESPWMRDRGKKDIDRSTRSRTPERSARRHHDGELDSDKSNSYRRKDTEKDGYREKRR